MSYANRSKEENRPYWREVYRRNVQRISSYKESRPCADCGNFYPAYVLDLDHVRGEKVRAVSEMANYSQARLDAELAKCEVVCSNCHRERTHSRLETMDARK